MISLKKSPLNNAGVTVVVGGGITGLTAAAELHSRGIETILLESADSCGGMARSFVLDEVVFDMGPHMLMLNPHRDSGRYLISLLKNERTYRRRYLFAVDNGGRYWQSPLTPAEFIGYPGWAGMDVLNALIKRFRTRQGNSTLKEYISRRSGSNVYTRVFEPLIRKKLGRTGDEIHENWWTRPPKHIQAKGNTAKAESDMASPASIAGKFFHDLLPHYIYPASGMGQVVKLIGNRFGGTAVKGCKDLKVRTDPGRIIRIELEGESIPVRALVWTAPVKDFYTGAGNKMPTEAATVSTRMVMATFRRIRPARRPYLYTYHHGRDTIFNRIYYPESIYRRDSPRGIEGLCFETRLTDAVTAMPENELISRISTDSARIGITTGEMISARTIDVQNASPLFAADYLEREKTLFRAAWQYRNLVFAGRQGNYCNCLIPGAVEQGLYAAEKVVEIYASD